MDDSQQSQWQGFLSRKEFADRVGVSDRTVWRMIHGGRLPAVWVGGQLRIPADALDQLPPYVPDLKESD